MKSQESALGKESDAVSQDRLATRQAELANLEQQSAELTQKGQAEQDKIHAEAKIKEQLDAARSALDQAQRAGDLASAGEPPSGTIPRLQQPRSEAQASPGSHHLPGDVTTAAQIGTAPGRTIGPTPGTPPA